MRPTQQLVAHDVAEEGLVGAVLGGMEGVLYIACVCADGNRRVPNVNANTDGDFKFNLGDFENDWNSDNCVLCFCDSWIFSRYFVGVFSCRFFFQPPSMRPHSSSYSIIFA